MENYVQLFLFRMNSEQDAVKPLVFADEKVTKFTDGKTIVKEIFVKNKIYNIVVK